MRINFLVFVIFVTATTPPAAASKDPDGHSLSPDGTIAESENFR